MTSDSPNPVAIAHKVAAFNTTDGNPYDVLNLAPGVPIVDLSSSVDSCRSNYRRLAGLIHPDRIKSQFEHATEAFQKLVRVFEMVSDPKVRHELQRRLAPSAARAPKSRQAKAKTTPKSKRKTAKSSPAASKKKTKKDSDASDDDGSDSFIVHDGSSEESEEDEVASSDGDVEVDYAETYEDDLGLRPSKARDNTGCYRTKIACPNCRERWQPDDDRSYVLFMKYGVKMHCATCLFQFGPATALHFCPLCKKSASNSQSEDGGYDVSQYDKKTTCRSCKKAYGYHSCLITEAALEGARDRIREEEAARKRSEERMLRALSRGIKAEEVDVMFAAKAPLGGGPASGGLGSQAGNGQLDMLVGQALVTGTCSICHKSVPAKNAQSHVEKCFSAPPKKATKKASLPKLVQEKDARKKPAAKKATKKKASPTKTNGAAANRAAAKPKAKKGPGKKRARDESDDEDDTSAYSSSD